MEPCNTELLNRYDTNESGSIEMAEVMGAAEDHRAGSITDTEMECVTQYWKTQADIPPSETIPGDQDGDFPVSTTAARDAVITFSLAAVIMYAIIKLIWR